MTLTLAQLLAPDSEDEAAEALFTQLAAAGFPTTNWAPDSVPVVLVRTFARALAEQAGLGADLAAGGLLELAAGPWLDLLVASAYGLARAAAQFATVRVRVSCAAGQGPHTIAANQLWIRRLSDGLRWNSANAAPVVVPSGSYVDFDFRSESPGAAYNAQLGQLLELITPLPGLSTAFQESAPGSGDPGVLSGTDPESDTSLRSRCVGRWDTIGVQKTSLAYDFLARNVPGVTSVTRVFVNDANPRGPGTVDLWVAGAVGPIGAGDLAAVNAYLQARKSPSTDLEVNNAVALAVNVVATLRCDGDPTLAVGAALQALQALINSTPLGGTLYRDEVIEALLSPTGARATSGLTLNGGGGDLVLAANRVATVGTLTVTGASL